MDSRGASTALVVEELATLPAAIRTRILMDAAISAGSGALEASHVNELDRLVTDYRGAGQSTFLAVRAWRKDVWTELLTTYPNTQTKLN